MIRRAAIPFVLVSVVTLSGCYGVIAAPHRAPHVVIHEPGPPPHAPAHGYHHKHKRGPELRFDSEIGVYIVIGRAGLYFHDGRFVRFHAGVWQISAHVDGPWKPGRTGWVPRGLRAKHHAKRHRRHGHGPAKGNW